MSIDQRDQKPNEPAADKRFDESVWASMGRELRTRDSDADIYETSFFTSFQDAAEAGAYKASLSGRESELGLELGCATGRMIPAMTSRTVVGIDLSLKELLIARDRFGASVPFVQASATHLPFREGTFDQILCSGVMLHLPDDDTRRLALQEMARVIARPTRLVIATHGYPWLVRRRYPKHRVHHELSWYRFDADELEGMIREELAPCRVQVRAICNIPRWRIGNRMGRLGVRIDAMLSRVPGLKYLTGTLLVAKVDCLPPKTRRSETQRAYDQPSKRDDSPAEPMRHQRIDPADTRRGYQRAQI
jgi:SAM-dependent methyltransferase